MPNELRVRQNFVGGLVEDNPLTSAATTLTSAALAVVPVIGATQHYPIILDPDGLAGEPEIVWVTAHTANAVTATILRAQEGTAAREHKRDIPWVHGPTAKDFDRFTGVRATRATAFSVPTGAFTTLPWDGEAFDTAALHDTATNPERIQIPLVGYWSFDISIAYNFASGGPNRYFRLMNGAAALILDKYTATSANNHPLMVVQSAVLYFSAADFVYVQLYQDSGAALSLDTTPSRTFLNANYLGA